MRKRFFGINKNNTKSQKECKNKGEAKTLGFWEFLGNFGTIVSPFVSFCLFTHGSMNSMEFALLLLVIIVGFCVLAYLLLRSKSGSPELVELVRILQSGSREDRNALNTRLDSASRAIAELSKSVGEMSEIGRNMKELQEFLKSPKIRGNVGEQVLKELLLQSLPKNSFNLQYAFRSGEKVDAAIKTSAGIIPIDSKFPMENFQKMASAKTESEKDFHSKAFEKDIRVHIDVISKKYINPDEGTIDYALMYIPSEAVYYEIVNNVALFNYAGRKKVLPVSPTTFYAYLKVIFMSFEGQKVEARAREILRALSSIYKDYEKVEEGLNVLNKHITNASNTMSNVVLGFGQLGQKIRNTKSLDQGEERKLEQ